MPAWPVGGKEGNFKPDIRLEFKQYWTDAFENSTNVYKVNKPAQRITARQNEKLREKAEDSAERKNTVLFVFRWVKTEEQTGYIVPQ